LAIRNIDSRIKAPQNGGRTEEEDLQVLQDIIDINNLPQTLDEFLTYNQSYLQWTNINGEQRLTSLDLSCQLNRCYLTDIGVEITQLPESLGNLSELRYLGMQGLGLTDLPNSLGTLVLLEEIVVYANDLGGPYGSGTMNDDVFENLTNLRELKIHDNPNLMELPENICNCSSLEKLYAYNSAHPSTDPEYSEGLWFLPECLHQLTNLKILHVNGNDFQTIDFDICSMTNLEEVYMNSNNLTGDIPECILGIDWEYGNFQISMNRLWCDYSNPETGCECGCAPQWYCDNSSPNGPFLPIGSGCSSSGYTNQRCGDCGYELGDINMDTGHNIQDIVLLVNYVLGQGTLTDEQIALADLNQDGVVNIQDVITLINIILNDERTTSEDRKELQRQISRLNSILSPDEKTELKKELNKSRATSQLSDDVNQKFEYNLKSGMIKEILKRQKNG